MAKKKPEESYKVEEVAEEIRKDSNPDFEAELCNLLGSDCCTDEQKKLLKKAQKLAKCSLPVVLAVLMAGQASTIE